MRQTKKTMWMFLCVVLALSAPAFAVVYVDDSAAPGGDGNGWATAYQTITAALPRAASEPVYIAAGSYAETSVTLTSGMQLYGGYDAATGNRNPVTNVTTVSGGGTHRVFAAAGATNVRLDGLAITDGRDFRGAGVYFSGGTGTIVNCNIYANTANSNGGGVGLDGVTSVTIANSTITNNFVGIGTPDPNGKGAGIGFDNKNANVAGSRLAVTNCIVTGNTTMRGSYCGGGICALGSSAQADAVIITGCDISQNVAGNAAGYYGGGGGGVAAENIEDISITNSTLSGNTASLLGGGIGAQWSKLTLTGCAMTGNTVTGVRATGGGGWLSNGGGAICFQGMDGSHSGGSIVLAINKSRIRNNVLNNAGGGGAMRISNGVAPSAAVSVQIANSIIEGTTADIASGQTGSHIGIEVAKSDANIVNLDVTNCTFKDNVDIGQIAGDWAALYGKMTAPMNVKNCIFVGTTSTNGTGQALDKGVNVTFTALNNLFYGNEAIGSQGTGPVLENPLFVGTGADPLSLTASSPAIDAGTSTGVTLTEDILGNLRPVDGPDADVIAQYDIGAYEFAAGPITPTPTPTTPPASASPERWMLLE